MVFYDYEYRLITTYGNKRVYTSVSIVDGTLYILNAQAYETADPERPTEEQKVKDEKTPPSFEAWGQRLTRLDESSSLDVNDRSSFICFLIQFFY